MTSYHDEQKERLRVLLQDRGLVRPDTLASRASAEANLENVGRHAKPETIIGNTPTPTYPPLPAGHWPNQNAAVPLEPPLGFDINALEPVGTVQEIQASLSTPDFSGSPSAPASVVAEVDPVAPTDDPSAIIPREDHAKRRMPK